MQISPESKAFIDEQVRAGRYDSAEQVIEAALATLRQQSTGDFEPGELEALIAEGQAELDRGEFFDGEAVFAELDALGQARRLELGK